ncbi:MAG: hypothetical protein JNK05_39945 [Myxococcales bacterium]|nr:hypothetical protein [Myxococcales bacterium]
MLWWFQRIARNGEGTHRDVIVVSDGPSGLRYTRIDAEGASTEITSSDVGVIAHEKTARFPLFTAMLVIAGLLSALMFSALPWLAALAFTVVMAMALVPLYNWQRINKTLAIVYAEDSPMLQQRFHAIEAMLQTLSTTHSSWLLAHMQAVFDPRLGQGPGAVVRRLGLRPWRGSPLPIETNLGLWSLDAPNARLVFLPDQLLVIASSRVASFAYSELRAQFSNADFVETEFPLPPDATVTSWRAIHNKKDGTPDRRYNQQQWPACAYSHLQFMAPNGVAIEVIASRADISQVWNQQWGALQQAISGGMRGYIAAPQPTPSFAPAAPVSMPAPIPATQSAPPNPGAWGGLPPPPVMPPAAATFAATGNAGAGVFGASAAMGAMGASAPTPSNTGAPGYALYAQTTPQERYSAVALLRYIAVADRKFSDDERAYILRATMDLFGVSPTEAEAILASAPTNESEIQSCAYAVSARGAVLARPLFEKIEQLPLIDGKATPKELERVAQVRSWLGV